MDYVTAHLSLLYIGFLTMIAIQQNTAAMQSLMTIFDDDLGQKVVVTEPHASDCSDLRWQSIAALFDFYALSHLLGWSSIAMLVRDRKMVWMLSIHWELIEVASVYQSSHPFLVALKECWYDSLLVDLFGCNMVGIELGLALFPVFGLEPYDWFARVCSKTKSITRTDMKKFAVSVAACLVTFTYVQFNAFILKVCAPSIWRIY